MIYLFTSLAYPVTPKATPSRKATPLLFGILLLEISLIADIGFSQM
jgi:hypothetical protein